MLISKIPMYVTGLLVLPDYGLHWDDLVRAVRRARLPLTSASVATVLSGYIEPSLPRSTINNITARLRYRLLSSQRRTWYMLMLSEPISSNGPDNLLIFLTSRVEQVMQSSGSRLIPEVNVMTFRNILYICVRLITGRGNEICLFLATRPGQTFALVSSLSSRFLDPCILALGFNKYEPANWEGRNIFSLLRTVRAYMRRFRNSSVRED